MKQSEKQIENAILDHLSHVRYCVAWKNETQGTYDSIKKVYRSNKHRMTGVADITCLYSPDLSKRPITLFLEVKTPIGRQSDNQKEFERKIKSINGLYFIVRSIDDVKKILESLINEHDNV